jgi:hypothetical protein
VQKELEARQSQTAGQLAAETEKQREEYQKKIEEGRARKGEALSFLQQLEDELVRRRNVEKEAVTKVPPPHAPPHTHHRTRRTHHRTHTRVWCGG